MRREAQLIIPNLYLGPFQSSINLARMKSMGITHVSVFSCRSTELLKVSSLDSKD